MQCSVDWFILQFRNIPSKKWVHTDAAIDSNTDSVYGHIIKLFPADYDIIVDQLRALFKTIGKYPACVNNDQCEMFDQTTPKARIMAALYAIKRKSKTTSV